MGGADGSIDSIRRAGGVQVPFGGRRGGVSELQSSAAGAVPTAEPLRVDLATLHVRGRLRCQGLVGDDFHREYCKYMVRRWTPPMPESAIFHTVVCE